MYELKIKPRYQKHANIILKYNKYDYISKHSAAEAAWALTDYLKTELKVRTNNMFEIVEKEEAEK